jgi:23S rRNA pseudouridine1911/1915/1917 synthase
MGAHPLTPTVIFEDNHLFVVNKPAGLLTQPSGTDQKSVEESGKAYIKEKYNKPGNVFLEAVHRIDKPVSGIVLFAKTSKALSRLNESMRNKDSHKIYVTMVKGILPVKEDVLKHYLIHDDFRASVCEPSHPDAKVSRLRYKVLQEYLTYSLLEIVLETGRYHQIRIQLSAEGFPIIGDSKYGSKDFYLPDAIALHHKKLQIPHPITGEMQVFEAPIPFSLSTLV